jgi:hypothetical protein
MDEEHGGAPFTIGVGELGPAHPAWRALRGLRRIITQALRGGLLDSLWRSQSTVCGFRSSWVGEASRPDESRLTPMEIIVLIGEHRYYIFTSGSRT